MTTGSKKRNLTLALTLSLMSATLLGCASKPASRDTWCLTNAPDQPTAAEYATFTHERKAQMDAHNSFGAKHCGWKP